MTETKPQVTGYARIEIMGHQQVTGWVTTEYFGSVAMLHVQMPAAEPIEQVLEDRQWIANEMLEKGSRIRITREAIDQYVGAASVYRVTLCSERTALAHQPQQIEVLERAERPQLAAGVPVGADPDDDDDGGAFTYDDEDDDK